LVYDGEASRFALDWPTTIVLKQLFQYFNIDQGLRL